MILTLDDDWRRRNVFVIAGIAGRGFGNLVDDVHALADFAEDGIAPTLRVVRRAVVEEIVVLQIDEELNFGRVRVRRTGHGNGAAIIGQPVSGFAFQGRGEHLLFGH